MTSIYKVPLKDIQKFIDDNEDKAKLISGDDYQKSLILLRDKECKGRPINLILWSMAYNILVNKINISIYSSKDINQMQQKDIDLLAKLLRMKGNDIEHIKQILRYLGKLDERDIAVDNDKISKSLEERAIIFVSEINEKSFYKNSIYGDTLYLNKERKWWYVRGNDFSQPSFNKGYSIAKIDSETSNIYTADGKKPCANLFSEYNGFECISEEGMILSDTKMNAEKRRSRLQNLDNNKQQPNIL